MKVEWTILLISAFTDFIITFATGLTVGTATTGNTYPTGPTLLYSAVGAMVAAMRTIQQALKSTSAITAALKGEVVATKTETTTTTGPTAGG